MSLLPSPASTPLSPGSARTLRDERELALALALEHHEFTSLADASELVLVRGASDAELQASWNAYQLDRGRGWN